MLLGVAAFVVIQALTSGTESAKCTVRAAGKDAQDHPTDDERSGDYEIKPVQAANGALIAAVASRRGLPDRAVTIALATAMQESGLHNVGHGDKDSIGLFQQRPSQGWGTKEEISDPVYSAGKFYDHLVKIDGYARLPLTEAAQRVQRSGFPEAYAKHEANASLLTAALTGSRGAALNCTPGPDTGDEEGSAAKVRKQLVREFGKDILPSGDGDGDGVSTGGGRSRTEQAQESQPTVSVPASGDKRGWELAHWALANASRLGIEEISYGDRVWSVDRAVDGWRDTEDGSRTSGVVLKLASGTGKQ